MNTILSKLNESVKALVANIEEAAKAIYDEANCRKEKLAVAIADMHDINMTMKEFANIRESLGCIDNVCIDMEVSYDNVETMLSDMDVFETPIEKFNGYCDMCGCEMSTDDNANLTEADEVVCDSCWDDICEAAAEAESEKESE